MAGVAVKAAVGVVEKGAAGTVQRAGQAVERAAEEKEAGVGRARRNPSGGGRGNASAK